jgi:hypothetical protein
MRLGSPFIIKVPLVYQVINCVFLWGMISGFWGRPFWSQVVRGEGGLVISTLPLVFLGLLLVSL